MKITIGSDIIGVFLYYYLEKKFKQKVKLNNLYYINYRRFDERDATIEVDFDLLGKEPDMKEVVKNVK